jgi:hypothetical protein
MSFTGKVRVMVRSRRVPVETAVIGRPIITPHGMFGTVPKRTIVYRTKFDQSDEEAIQEGRRLSSDLGLDLEVVDLSRLNPFRRLASSFRLGSVPITIIPAPGFAQADSMVSSAEADGTGAECNPSSSIP